MSPDDCFLDPEELQAFVDSMTEFGWVGSQIDPTKWVEGEHNPAESFDRSPDVQHPYDMQSGRNTVPAPLPSGRYFVDPFAAYDAGTCGCKFLAQIEASLEKSASDNGFTLTADQLRQHVENIDAINRKTHLGIRGRAPAQRSAFNTQSSQQERGECLLQSTCSTS